MPLWPFQEGEPSGENGPSPDVRRTRSRALRFGVALAAVAVVLAFRLLLNALVGHGSPLLLFTPAVMLAAWYGGLWPGLSATVASAIAAAWFLPNTPADTAVVEWDRLALFLFVGGAVSWLQVKVAADAARIAALLRRERRARAEAEEANRAKDEFMARVSHELRTPLSVILGWVSMLKAHSLDDRSVRKAAEVIERNARLQQRLVEDIVETSAHGGQRTVTLDRGRVDLSTLLLEVVEASRPAAVARGVDLRLAMPRARHHVWGEAVRLQQVLMNVLTNAMKFTPQGGRVEVELMAMAGTARITVTDTGRGIEAELLPHVFEPFKKGEDSEAGLGLGLAIVRQLVETHGGTVTARSPGSGRGTSIELTLPLASVVPSATVEPAESQERRASS